ncbi:hypothetical protein [Helicobacter turcicus]|uniref:Uncharacterized protein n=1 Tax=Helicobacter turcicus TaxID=2867412 RepID=A0ABS7JPB6_9HELI|nr:hypothetical protein [Helicobacter turcicus]MBX7491251.1 hypothetical protein [Helicobacter turcicus]MBX7546110.1 hypothetical protein [Helicobacter turcicus]
MRLDEEKERLADLRRYQNYCILGVVGLISWLFVDKLQDEILSICAAILLVFFIFSAWFLSIKISEKYEIIGKLDRNESKDRDKKCKR